MLRKEAEARITVIGAGPGGLAAARGLLDGGHEVRVFERAPGLRSGGSAVTVWPNGAAVLATCGVSLEGLGPTIDVLDGRTDRGRPLLRMSTGRLGARLRAPTLSVPRRRLVQQLISGLPADTVAFDKICESVDPGTGQVTFSDGTTAEADVVVGADGHGSAVRRALRPEMATRPTGWVTWQGLSAVPINITDSSIILTMLGRAGFCGLQPAGDGLLQWYLSVPPDPRPGAAADPFSLTTEPLVMLRERFGDWAPPVPQVLDALVDADITPWVHHTQPVPEVWGAGRATLIGDAAHTMPPSLAQGVNQTLEDAHALTCALTNPGTSTAGDPTPLLRRYERARARQVRRIARMAGSEASTTYRPSTQLLMRVMPDRLSAMAYARLIERSSSVLGTRSPRAR